MPELTQDQIAEFLKKLPGYKTVEPLEPESVQVSPEAQKLLEPMLPYGSFPSPERMLPPGPIETGFRHWLNDAPMKKAGQSQMLPEANPDDLLQIAANQAALKELVSRLA